MKQYPFILLPENDLIRNIFKLEDKPYLYCKYVDVYVCVCVCVLICDELILNKNTCLHRLFEPIYECGDLYLFIITIKFGEIK